MHYTHKRPKQATYTRRTSAAAVSQNKVITKMEITTAEKPGFLERPMLNSTHENRSSAHHFSPDDGASTLHRNVGFYRQVHTAL
jgi:hypothetical protein